MGWLLVGYSRYTIVTCNSVVEACGAFYHQRQEGTCLDYSWSHIVGLSTCMSSAAVLRMHGGRAYGYWQIKEARHMLVLQFELASKKGAHGKYVGTIDDKQMNA